MMQTLRKLDASLGLVLDDGAKIMFLIFSAVALILCLAYQFLAVTHRYSLDYGEAPLVDQAMRLASGQNIYRADISTPPYTISNYPPLYVALVAASVRFFGPSQSFFVGRIISILSAWASSILLMLIVYAPTRDRFAALSAGLIFLAFPFVVYWSPLLRIDMLALALSLAGLYLLAEASAEGEASFASPEPSAEAGATTAAADTPNFSSKVFTSSCKSSTDIVSICFISSLNLSDIILIGARP